MKKAFWYTLISSSDNNHEQQVEEVGMFDGIHISKQSELIAVELMTIASSLNGSKQFYVAHLIVAG